MSVKGSSGEFSMSDNLNRLEILTANDRFYLALSQADPTLMSQVWRQHNEVYCIHPGWDRLEGWEAVIQSWKAIFNNQGPCPVVASAVKVSVYGDMAWVNCFENIAVSDIDLQIIRTICTNVFQRIDRAWKLVIHHSSIAPLATQTFGSSESAVH